MAWYDKIIFALSFWWWNIKLTPIKIKRFIWNKHILFWWYNLWIRKNEFHPSLRIDDKALNKDWGKNKKYLANIAYRIKIAHQRNP